ncbi:hypothetical protein HanXRQr2_Chr04g0186521 [Helianthus annuus]|uniref:Uncharacterized protein n=1 Tax=Helianthus annuus TaxID=4232 RepID=A0A9K3JCG9_HELAN|nr:hypothetical protein HanXRQr2_Chr04g0186521 [Helianthus annuus]
MLLHDLTLSTSALHDLPYKRKKTRSGCRAFKTSTVTKLSLRFLPSIVQIILWGSHKLLKFFKILTLVNQDNDKTALQAVSHGSSVHDIVYMLFNGL